MAILGSGISGLSSAQLLKHKHEVYVFEKQNSVGGLIKCERVNDCLFHKVGGHVFNSKNQSVLNWFWSFFNKDLEFVKVKRNAKVLFDNEVIGYPIENYLFKLNKTSVSKIIGELLQLDRIESKNPMEYKNFEMFLKGNFGNTLFEIYFEPYNKKIWQTDLSKVPMEWLEGKLPMPNLKEILYSNIVREEEHNMVHSEFFYPKNEGSQFIVDRLSQGLKIFANSNCENITLNDGGIYINEQKFDKIIYTGDIRKIPESIKSLLISNKINWTEVMELKSNGTSNLFCETDDSNISWLYIPQNFTKAHRIIYTGNFSKSNNRGTNRTTCVVEFSGHVDYEIMISQITKLPGNLRPLSSNYEPNSYVIQELNTRNLINKIKTILEKNNIYLLGRFAEWEYYNMDKAIEAAFLLIAKLD